MAWGCKNMGGRWWQRWSVHECVFPRIKQTSLCLDFVSRVRGCSELCSSASLRLSSPSTFCWIEFTKCVAGDSVRQISVTVLSSCEPASDREHLAMFTAVQVQREASRTIEQGKLAAAPLCGKHHHTPSNHNKWRSNKELRKLLFFPHSVSPRWILQKHFLDTTPNTSQQVTVTRIFKKTDNIH